MKQIKVKQQKNNFVEIFKQFAKIDSLDLIQHISKSIVKHPDLNWVDALSDGQLLSKKWLIDELQKSINMDQIKLVYNLASWYGILSFFLLEKFEHLKIRNFDIDEMACKAADSVNYKHLINDWKAKAVTKNMFDINYQNHDYSIINSKGQQIKIFNETPDLIINCSCEHVDFVKWLQLIPKNKLVCIQNNNAFFYNDHINCVHSLNEFEQKVNLSKILYSGELNLPNYTRFMIIGVV